MDATDTLTKTEKIIAELSEADKVQLLKWLEKEVKNGSLGIEKTENVNGRCGMRSSDANSRLDS